MQRTKWIILTAPLFLGACALQGNFDADAVQALPSTGSAFQQTLHADYAALAKMERAEFDWDDTDHFNTKAIAASSGGDVSPDDPATRELPADQRPALAEAFGKLQTVLANGAIDGKPTEAAHAQAYFDCWLQEIEEDIPTQHADVEMCRSTFLAAMKALKSFQRSELFVLLPNLDGSVGAIAVNTKGGAQELNQPRQATRSGAADAPPSQPTILDESQVQDLFGDTLSAAPIPPKTFILYFQENSTELTADSVALLPEVSNEFSLRKSFEIGISGHTDRVGSAGYNAKLSLKRAMEVRDILTGRGIDGKTMDIQGHGEGNPLIPTPDGKAEPKNRRVEITVR